jgi:gluconolactonase
MTRHFPALFAVAAAFALPSTALAAACGKAPSGEMTAQRIASIKPTRNEPGLYEGPVWVKETLYFSDFAFSQGFPSRIRKLAADGSVSTLTEDGGSNGLAVDANGDLVVASHKDKALMRQSLKDGKRTPIAQRYDGNVFNSPNDIAITTDGTIYFTDPDYQKAAAPGGQPVTGIYRVAKDGKVTLIDGTRKNPNGIALSQKEDVLYVNASDDEVRSYPIVNGVPQQGRMFARIEGGDGMTLDCHGNLYVTEHGAKRVRVFSPEGKELATIRVDANVTNVAFGGAGGKTLYITGAGAVWQLPLEVTGRPY